MSIEREMTGTFMMFPFSWFFSCRFTRNDEGARVTGIYSKSVHAFVCMNGAGPFLHDPLDSVSAATALGAASEAGIHLAHTGPSRLFSDNRPHLMVAEHIARTDDHRVLLTNTNESDEDRNKRGAPASRKHDGPHSGHLGVAKRPLAH
jgi:hypothetical protein